MTRPFLDALLPVIRDAATLIEQIRETGAATRTKADRSPVTEADERAEALIVAALRRIDPETQIVGEEACEADGKPAVAERFWLIDPLDGTKSFLDGGADYSVNIGLIDNGAPVFGLVMAPRTRTIWAGIVGDGAWRFDGDAKAAIRCRALPARPVVVTSRSHNDDRTMAYVARIPGAEVKPSGSSLKFCMIAEGEADVYPRFGPTSEWDTAAAHAVLLAAGGAMVDAAGAPFRYGKADYLNGPFLAWGDPTAYAGLPSISE
ncbi:3'(2'),5'-bisphosphate nucleotidase CysQ [Sphingosinicella sp.]|uniref:3'(2'),5'-bisphosphate nucleotidase CysQ n=1 Tax=Sphingosinicella sp. TaxID=1917971 RepID=UPI0035B3F171